MLLFIVLLSGIVIGFLPKAIHVLNIVVALLFLRGILLLDYRGFKYFFVSSIIVAPLASLLFFPLILWRLLLQNKGFRVDLLGFLILLFFLYSLLLALNTLFYRFLIPWYSWMTFLSPAFLIFLALKQIAISNDERTRVISFIKKLYVTELFVGLLQFLNARFEISPLRDEQIILYDSVKGSFGNAHTMGFFLFFGFVYFLFQTIQSRFRLVNIFILVFILLVIGYTDSKTYIAFLLLAVAILLPSLFLKFGFVSKLKALSILAAGFVILYGIYRNNVQVVEDASDLGKLVVKQYYENEYSKKVGFFNSSIEGLWAEEKAYWLFGVGGGEFGSRGAEVLSADELYKPTFPSFHFSSRWVQEYMTGLHSKEFFEEIKQQSFLLSVYYSEIIAIKNETGLIGFLVFVIFIVIVIKKLLRNVDFRINKNGYLPFIVAAMILSLFFLSFIEFSFSLPTLTIPVFILASFVLSGNNN